MTGRCSKCKEMCEAEKCAVPMSIAGLERKTEYLSNCCGAPLIEDGERSHNK
jgi:hypothetical protein